LAKKTKRKKEKKEETRGEMEEGLAKERDSNREI